MSEKQKREAEGLETAEEKYVAYFDALQSELNNALIHLDFHDFLEDSRRDYLAEFNEAHTFFQSTINAHRDAVILSMAKLLKDQQDSISVWSFLRFVENNLDLFSTEAFSARLCSKYNDDGLTKSVIRKHKKLTLRDIQADRAQLEEFKQAIGHIEGWRDKEVAHSDKSFKLSKKKVSQEFPMSSDDLKRIMEQVKQLLNKYNLAYDASSMIFGLYVEDQVKLIFDSIRFRSEELRRKRIYETQR